MKTALKYWQKLALPIGLLLLAATLTGYFLGWINGGMVPILTIVEISLSFDNAVINAVILNKMDEKWQRRFVNWGIWIAVIVVRLLLPILVVVLSSHLGFVEVVKQAVLKPDDYARELTSAQPVIDMAAGIYLLQIGLSFFLEESDTLWIKWIEMPFAKLGKLKTLSIIIASIVTMVVAHQVGGSHEKTLLYAGFISIVVYNLVSGIADMFEDGDSWQRFGSAILFLYLELQDASFSFDGVSGAFALTTNIFVIAVGLGFGAWYIRKLTVVLVKTRQLSKLPYLEHGAFYAITTLATLMLVQEFIHFTQTEQFLAGLAGVVFILAAGIHSLIAGPEIEILDEGDSDNQLDNSITPEGAPTPVA